MIETCKQYITSRNTEKIWKQERIQICKKLNDCVRLNMVYHDSYALLQQQNSPITEKNSKRFQFSENYVFGKFDSFCSRLKKIISLFDLIEDYNNLFETRMEGTNFLLLSNNRWYLLEKNYIKITTLFLFCFFFFSFLNKITLFI